jgi:hypothetical protein
MTAKKVPLLVLGVTLLALLLAVPQVTPVSALQMQYFPMAPGSSLIYNSTNDDGSWMTQRYVANETEFLGGFYGTFTVLWSEAHMMPGESSYTWKNHMWISKTSDTLLWWGFEDENTKIICSSPLRYVTEPVVVGAVQSGTTTATLTLKANGTVISPVSFSGNYTIDEIESVTVPAGTFSDCIKVHEEEITPDGQVSFWVWYAPNVGAVQYYYPQQGDRWDVLEAYSVDPANDPWDSWFLPQVPTVLLITTVVAVVVVALVVIRFLLKRRA